VKSGMKRYQVFWQPCGAKAYDYPLHKMTDCAVF